MNSISDLIDFDSLLTPEERKLRDKVRTFVDAEIKPNIAQWYESAVVPLDIVPALGRMGLLGMHLKGYGCAGGSAVERRAGHGHRRHSGPHPGPSADDRRHRADRRR